MTKLPLDVTGTVRWTRSDRLDSFDCVCCEGAHVYSRHVELDPGAPETIRDRRIDSAELSDSLNIVDWLYEVLRRVPEGARIHISAIVLPAALCGYSPSPSVRCKDPANHEGPHHI